MKLKTSLGLLLVWGLIMPPVMAAEKKAPAIAVDVEPMHQNVDVTLRRAKSLLKKAGVKDMKLKGWSLFGFKDGYSLVFRVLPDEKNYIIMVSGPTLKTGMHILNGFKKNLKPSKKPLKKV